MQGLVSTRYYVVNERIMQTPWTQSVSKGTLVSAGLLWFTHKDYEVVVECQAKILHLNYLD